MATFSESTQEVLKTAQQAQNNLVDTAESIGDGLTAEFKEFVGVLVDANIIDTEKVALDNGRYALKPRGFGEYCHWHRFWWERAWRLFLIMCSIALSITFLVLLCYNIGYNVPLFAVSSADSHYPAAAAFLATNGITYKYARVPAWMIAVEIMPAAIAMTFSILFGIVVAALSLDFWTGHISNAEFISRDLRRRKDGSETSTASHWFQNSYSRVSGINMAVNTMSSYGIDPSAPWIDLFIFMGFYVLYPVFVSAQDYMAFALAFPLALMDCYTYYGNLYKIAMETNPKGIVMGILVHFLVRMSLVFSIFFVQFDWFLENTHYEAQRTRWAMYWFIAALTLHLVFAYLGAIRRAFLHWSGKGGFDHRPSFWRTERLDSVPLGSSTRVSTDPNGREVYFDKMAEGFTWAFLSPKLATFSIMTIAFLVEVTCICWMEDTLYVK